MGFANYTYQVSTRGHFGKGRIYQDPSEQRKYDWDTRNLYQERPIPRPYARASLTFYTPAAFGPKTIGIYFLGNWTMTVLADWRAGDWLTWNPNNHPAIAQNVQAKDWYNIRLRLTKTVSFKKWDITFLVDVNNALNTKRLSLNSFYDTNDYLDYFNSLHLPRSNAYNNIVGKDKVGDYRKEGVPFQPIEQVGIITKLTDPEPGVIYYGKLTETDDQLKYYHYVNGTWSEVEKKRMQKILDDKAYINMPNLTTFNFLNPRDIFIGIRTSFNL
ncbi:MAG: hypothetical protein ONB05_03280 [candidate division KSB1 bacterium]|nr:hypothetical protein [candidate division KSB1 bacterium]